MELHMMKTLCVTDRSLFFPRKAFRLSFLCPSLRMRHLQDPPKIRQLLAFQFNLVTKVR
jgi:hypothetical protein